MEQHGGGLDLVRGRALNPDLVLDSRTTRARIPLVAGQAVTCRGHRRRRWPDSATFRGARREERASGRTPPSPAFPFHAFSSRPRMSISYRPYVGDRDLQTVVDLVHSELSEPYVVYTYRYFLDQWPQLCLIAEAGNVGGGSTGGRRGAATAAGVIVCKQSTHKSGANRGYIAMLSVASAFRKRGIARTLVERAVRKMQVRGASEVVLETECDNAAALSLYESLGFIREKRLFRFYLNGKDAYRLVLELVPRLPTPSRRDQYFRDGTYPPATPSPFAEEDAPPLDVDA